MGILDELKQQAEQARAHQETEAEHRARLERNYQENILPRMIALSRYLFEMLEQLKIIQPEIPVIYKLPGIGPAQLRQGLFRINMDRADQPKKISLLMECAANESATYPINSIQDANEVRAFLDKQKMEYTEWAIRDKNDRVCGANFEGRLKVITRLLIQVDLEHDRIEIITSNFEGLGTKKMTFNSAQINQEWFDELGHYLLRREAKLGSLDIADHEREMIRTQLTNWEEERRKELEATATREDHEEKTDNLLSGLRKTLNKPLW